MSAKTISSKT